MRVNQNRFAKRVAAAVAGIFFLCAAQGPTRAQGSQPGPMQTPHMASPAARPKRDIRPPDYFAGLTFTDDQKSKIDGIHRDMESRMDVVNKDQKLSAEKKEAMLDGSWTIPPVTRAP